MLQKEKSQHTKQAILDAAFQEIYVNGYQAASLSKILSNLRMTKGALYHHFKNKKEIGLAVIDINVSKFLDQLWISPLKAENDPIIALKRIIMTYRGFTDGNQGPIYGCPLNNLIQEMSPLDEDFNGSLQKLYKRWQKTMISSFKKGKEQKLVSQSVEAEEAAHFIMASFWGIMSITKNQQSKKIYLKMLTQLENYINGLTARKL